MSSAVGKQSSVGNERGATTSFRLHLGSNTTLYGSTDLFCTPAKSSEQFTEKGNVLKVKLLYKTFQGISAYYQLSHTVQTGDSLGLTTRSTHTLYASLPVSNALQMKFSVRLSAQSDDFGVLTYEDVVWKPLPRLTFSTRFAQFNASFDNRLYAWEDDVQYVFASAQYYYAGTYWYVVAKWKCLQKLSLEMKLAQTRYANNFPLPESYTLYPEQKKIRGNVLVQIAL
jgi:LysM repeat protein